MNTGLPTRSLRERPDIDQLKRQAKELLRGFQSGDPAATAEVQAHYRGADPATLALHDALLVLARAHGFESWPKLKAHVDGVTVRRLVEVVRTNDLAEARAMLERRPELARMSMDNLQVVHHAVLGRLPEMVRLLMRHGANARDGVYPHREATTAFAIAEARGYAEIVAIIEEEEQRRPPEARPVPDELFQAVRAGDVARAQALLDAGADANRRWRDFSLLDFATYGWNSSEEMVRLLLAHGAEMDGAAAVVLGDVEWLRARNAEGTLANRVLDSGGLLRIAAAYDRFEILRLLLDFGVDPDERTRCGDGDDLSFTQGMALQYCAGAAKYEMAELLLSRGANPNAQIMASGDPVFTAYSVRDQRMIDLLGRHGGVPAATAAGLYRLTDMARRMLSGEAPYRLDGVGGPTVEEQLLWGGACGGDPEIVRMALERIDWAPGDARWFQMLEQPLRTWTHGDSSGWDRGTYVTCFRLLLERADPNLRGRIQDNGAFGLTILHSIAGSREHLTPEERVAFATLALDAGGRLDIRDNLLQGTPLDWALRWERPELVRLFRDRGALR